MRGDESIQEKADPFETPDNERPGAPSGGEDPPIDPQTLRDRDLYYDWDSVRCPRCDRYQSGYPALSRVDNTTYICSLCGTDEGITVMYEGNNVLPLQGEWPLDHWTATGDVIEEVDQQ